METEKTYTEKPQPGLSSHTEDAASSSQHIPATSKTGLVVGGKHAQSLSDSSSLSSSEQNITTFDFDLPPTATQATVHDGKERILLDFVEGDKENPFNWDPRYKAFISVLLCLMTLFIGLATTAYSSGIDRMTKDLGVSTILGQLGLFTFNFTCALAPLFLAPFCELAGRRVIYVGAYICFGLMFIGLALGKNIATILVCRALLGLFGCVGTILVGGTFGDMYRPEERAIPMASFSYIAILGTVGAPIYAGFIDQALGWRWVEGIQGLANIPLAIVCFFCLRETRGSVALGKRADLIRRQTGDERYVAATDLEAPDIKTMLYNSSIKAGKMLITEPVVFAFGLWIAFAWFLAFLFLSVIPITFQEKKGWGEGVSGLPYISLCLGTTIGFGLNFLQIRKYNSIVAQNGTAPPEARLYGALFGAVWLPVGLFIYSFTQYAFLHWIGPFIALVLITIGIFFIFESCYSFTSDCYGESSSSAIAGQGFMRNTLGAVSPLFASQFFHNVGSQYAGLILALVATFLTFIPYVLFWWGPALRKRSRLASTNTGF
ncbi:major facilitator superfamily domain-containing protein [Aspergillus pseudonomiae]|uniref:Major facilitator superfamily domain-containing protein n=1 Tax=Aspergillus pseudonomiae TaxID=1506151 RepID=A0A5N7DU42_9EURO|nr:major facilitator superfamily domain-containing protein [Aspergillus pseudonomiae]KAB8266173.1 major facilitator superfamily domain-containing protein [Aspergillus pseudonomiae]KAE8409038.1 major facilitator superfamily domain-containing protein [Aspergillus pseudonomiae]